MNDRNIKIALIVALVVAALAIIWYAAGAANAQPAYTPKCVPAYTQDPRNDVGGQLFSLSVLPFMVAVAGPVIQDKNDQYNDLTQLRGLCTTLAVAKHAAGLKEYAPQDTR